MTVDVSTGLTTIWIVLSAAMIVFMEGGFSLLEAGFVRTKNAVNVTMKIFVDLTFGALAFFVMGFGLMFGGDWHSLIGTQLFSAVSHLSLPNHIPLPAYVMFQMAFAMAVASIISGAVAERMKFSAYILSIVLVCGILYPISGHWVWSPGGWLNKLGIEDFAGSLAIHAMGGCGALALAKVLGPRRNRFNKDGSVNVFAPSNIPLASAGAFILWFGWFGFNAGSTLNALDANLSQIALNTFLAAAAGGMSAIVVSILRYKIADPSLAINGSLAGLVAITAGCAYVSQEAAILIGFVGGILVVFATQWVDLMKVDDPVGAVAVHGFNGIWGTIAVGLFDLKNGLFTTGHLQLFLVQLLGIIVVCLWGYFGGYGIALMIKRTIGIRVSDGDEEEGLDLVAHGIPAYNELERFSETLPTQLPSTLEVTEFGIGVTKQNNAF